MAYSTPVTSPDKGRVLDEKSADTVVCKKKMTKEITPAQTALGDQGRIDKLATGTNPHTTKNTQKLTVAKNSLTVGT